MAWSGEFLSGILANVGIVAGLLFSGLGFWREARVRRTETLIQLTRHHRDLWLYFDEHPELSALFEADRDMTTRPLTDREMRFVGFLLNHIRSTFYGSRAGIYVQPECLDLDIRTTFAFPASRDAWQRVKKYHDAKFVAFFEKIVG